MTGLDLVIVLFGDIGRELQLAERGLHLILGLTDDVRHGHRHRSLAQSNRHLIVVLGRGTGIRGDRQCHTLRRVHRILVLRLVMLDIIEAGLLERVQRVLAIGRIRVENILRDGGHPHALGHHHRKLLIGSLAYAAVHNGLGLVHGRRDDLAFRHVVAVFLVHLVGDAESLQRALIRGPIRAGQRAFGACIRIAGHVIRLGHTPIASRSGKPPPAGGSADCSQYQHDHQYDDERFFAALLLWPGAVGSDVRLIGKGKRSGEGIAGLRQHLCLAAGLCHDLRLMGSRSIGWRRRIKCRGGGDRRSRRIDVCGATGIDGIACDIIGQKRWYGRLERCCTGRYAGQRGLLGDIAYQRCSGGIGMITSDGFGMQTVLPRLQRQFGGQLAQFLSCCRAIGGAGIHLTRGQMGDERRHGRINALTDRGHGRHVLMNMLENKRHRIIRIERHLAGQHLPCHDAHRIQVALRGGLIVLDHFGSQISGGAQ